MYYHLETFWQQFITKKSDCLRTKQLFKICLRIIIFWFKRIWNHRCALDFEFLEDATSQRKTALNLDKQTRPPYHFQINPSFSKRGHFCGIQYSYNILDKVQNHFC